MLSQQIKNNDKERILSVLKFLKADSYDTLNIVLQGESSQIAAYRLFVIEHCDLSQISENANQIDVFIQKNDKGYYIEVNVWYKDGEIDEAFIIKRNMSLSKTMAWVEDWLKQYPRSKVYYDTPDKVSFFGHKHKPTKKQPKYAYLENSVKKMF